MIKSIRIKNYRSCKNVVIQDLGVIVALIGRNGAGKTNVLRALDWLARVATTSDHTGSAHSSFSPDEPSTYIEIEVELSGHVYQYSLERLRTVHRKKEGPPQLELTLKETVCKKGDTGSQTVLERHGQTVKSDLRKGDIGIGSMTGSLIGIVSVLPKSDPLVTAIRPLCDFLLSVKYYPIDEPSIPRGSLESNWISDKAYAGWSAQYAETGNAGDSVVMRLIHMALTKKEKLDELKHLLGRNNLGLIDDLHIQRIPVAFSGTDEKDKHKPLNFYLVAFRPSLSIGRSDFGFSYEDLSTGTRRTIKLLVSLLFDSPEVMLLEHPEDGIHSGLVKKLIRVLQTTTGVTQVFLTSHSTTVLNELQPDAIRMVAMKGGKTSVHALSEKQLMDAKDYLAEEGTLAEFVDLAEE